MPRAVIDGKPRFYFVGGPDEQWRQAEKFVAVIESLLRPDALAYSPLHVPNVVGDREELDVVFKALGDATAPFSFVQVRDRNDVQGRPWLQQLIGQLETLGVKDGTLVSTSGFADTVVKLARAKGIPIRELREDPCFGGWYKGRFLRQTRNSFTPVRCVVAIADPGRTIVEIDGKQAGSALVADLQADLFRRAPLPLLFDRFVKGNPSVMGQVKDKLEPQGHLAHADFTVIFDVEPPPVWYARGPAEIPVPVLAINFTIQLCIEEIDSEIAHRIGYEDAQNGRRLAEAVIAEFSENGVKMYLAIVKTFVDGERVGGAYFA